MFFGYFLISNLLHSLSCNLCRSASSLVAFIPLVGMLSLPILFSYRRHFRCFAFAAFSSVACSIFACSSPLLFRVFSCNLWLLLYLCCFDVLSVALFVCNLWLLDVELLDSVWLADAVNLFSLKNVRGGIGILLDVLISCLCC